MKSLSRDTRLDILRGVSIIMVLFFHLTQLYFDFSSGHSLHSYDASLHFSELSILCIVSFFGKGYLGVYLFFLLSGYLIYSIYDEHNQINWVLFFKKRFWRIYPIYFFLLVFFFILFHKYDDVNLKDFLFHSFLIHNFSADTFYSINPSFWSLSVEIQFYLLFPLLSMLSSRFGIIKVFLVTLIISFFVEVFDLVHQLTFLSTLKFLFMWQFGGVLVRYKNVLCVFYKKYRVILYIIFLFIYMCMVYPGFSLSYFQLYVEFLFCVLIFLIGLFFDSTPINENLRSIVVRVGSFFALLSYSLYLLHQPLLYTIKNFFKGTFDYAIYNFCLELLFIFVVLSLVSYSLYHLIELKFLNFSKKSKVT